jgi:hypothetical protein
VYSTTSTTPTLSIATSTSSTASGTSTVSADGSVPSDGGCPTIEGKKYTPYAVDGQPIPLQDGLSGQSFQQQCYTNWVSNSTDATHDILRLFMPTLENCMMACAEYNSAYRKNVKAGVSVGGGYCVAVTIAKEEAGFCLLKNSTGANDTLGRPQIYSSGILLTDLDEDL